MFFISAVKGDGTVLVRPYKESFENAEAERAALREKRQK
jgi:hypothetical protein